MGRVTVFKSLVKDSIDTNTKGTKKYHLWMAFFDSNDVGGDVLLFHSVRRRFASDRNDRSSKLGLVYF